MSVTGFLNKDVNTMVQYQMIIWKNATSFYSSSKTKSIFKNPTKKMFLFKTKLK